MKVSKHDLPMLMAEAVLYGMPQTNVTEELVVEYVLKRQRADDLAVDKKKSMDTKLAWKRDRSKYQRSIDRFHKSAEGKRFHRSLARFNARGSASNKKDLTPAEQDRKDQERERKEMRAESRDIIALASLKTSLNICNEYLVPGASLQLEWDDFYRAVNSELTEIIRVSETGIPMTEDQHLLVQELLHPGEIRKFRDELIEEGSDLIQEFERLQSLLV